MAPFLRDFDEPAQFHKGVSLGRRANNASQYLNQSQPISQIDLGLGGSVVLLHISYVSDTASFRSKALKGTRNRCQFVTVKDLSRMGGLESHSDCDVVLLHRM